VTQEEAYRILGAFGRSVAKTTRALDQGEVSKQEYLRGLQGLLEDTLRELGLTQRSAEQP
jgi:hypothetical protein